MAQALYRKHRSKSLDEIVGQEHITATLKQALEQGRISHAYLFTGPRGVGKTSIARILAHEINGLPYDHDQTHIDVIEIDAASNRRIDEIRDLRDKVYVAPVQAKYKVYIIDEVHMLTREAFNALLKTLEEPPAHAVFILATTDAHKVPETIISRTQRFTFKPVPAEQVISHLQHIAKQEKLEVSNEALALLAQHGEGSFRDSISLLDQAAIAGHRLEVDDVRALLGIAPHESIESLLQLLQSGQPAEVMSALRQLYDQGYQAAGLAKQLGERLREQLAVQPEGYPLEWSVSLLKRLLAVPPAHEPQRLLELVLLEQLPQATGPAAPTVVTAAPAAPSHRPTPAPNACTEPKPETPIQAETAPAPSTLAPADPADWGKVLPVLKRRHNTLYGVIRMAEPKFINEDNLELHFAFAFHQKRINEPANRQIVTTILQEISGRPISINCHHTKTAKPPVVVAQLSSAVTKGPAAPSEQSLQAITHIFGGGEVVDS